MADKVGQVGSQGVQSAFTGDKTTDGGKQNGPDADNQLTAASQQKTVAGIRKDGIQQGGVDKKQVT